jgi:glutamyl-tRNA synthetase
MVESSDISGVEVGENIVLSRWGVVKITKVEGGIEGEYVPDGDLKACKRKLTWLSESEQNIQVKVREIKDTREEKGEKEIMLGWGGL